MGGGPDTQIGGTLFIHETGSGPAVLLLHGAPSSVAYFDPLVELLAADWRVLIPEFPGYGHTPFRPGSVRAAIDELDADLASRGVHEAAVVGFSQGAYRALVLALDGKTRVNQIFMMGGFASLAPAHRDSLRAMGQLLATLPDFQVPALRRQFATGMVSPGYAAEHPEVFAQIESWIDATTPAALSAEILAGADDADLRPRLRDLAAPLVARVGELDQAAPKDYSEELVALVPAGSLQIVPGRGHALLIEDRAATLAAVKEALGAGRH